MKIDGLANRVSRQLQLQAYLLATSSLYPHRHQSGSGEQLVRVLSCLLVRDTRNNRLPSPSFFLRYSSSDINRCSIKRNCFRPSNYRRTFLYFVRVNARMRERERERKKANQSTRGEKRIDKPREEVFAVGSLWINKKRKKKKELDRSEIVR